MKLTPIQSNVVRDMRRGNILLLDTADNIKYKNKWGRVYAGYRILVRHYIPIDLRVLKALLRKNIVIEKQRIETNSSTKEYKLTNLGETINLTQ
jgi:hypothetical protein